MISFLPPLADAAQFPPPLVPAFPVLTYRDLVFGRGQRCRLGARCELTVSGRAAIGRIAHRLALGPESRVLVPAYHCPSLVEPLAASGASVDFYPLTSDLNPEPEAFERALARCPDLVVFVRFFGFCPDIGNALRASRETGARVLHDCAHAYYALPDIPEQDFAIGSLAKFFAVEEGGVMLHPVPRGRIMDEPPMPPPGTRDARLMWRSLERAGRSRRLRPFSTLVGLIDKLRAPASGHAAGTSVAAAAVSAHSAAFRYYDPACREVPPAAITRFLVRRFRAQWAARRRRSNFRRIAEALRGRADVHPLFGELPANVVPYVFPLVLHDPAKQFDALRRRGVPLYRWEELAVSDCTVSARYRASLVQLPCHQHLSETDLERLLEAVSKALESI